VFGIGVGGVGGAVGVGETHGHGGAVEAGGGGVLNVGGEGAAETVPPPVFGAV